MVFSPWLHLSVGRDVNALISNVYIPPHEDPALVQKISAMRPKWFSYLPQRNFGIDSEDQPVCLDPIIVNWLFTDVEMMNPEQYKALTTEQARYYLMSSLMFLFNLREKPLLNKIAKTLQSLSSSSHRIQNMLIKDRIDNLSAIEMTLRLNLYGSSFSGWYSRSETETLLERCIECGFSFLACELVHRGFEVSFEFCMKHGEIGSLLYSISEGNKIKIQVPRTFIEDHTEPSTLYKINGEPETIVSNVYELATVKTDDYCSVQEIYRTDEICEETGAEIIDISPSSSLASSVTINTNEEVQMNLSPKPHPLLSSILSMREFYMNQETCEEPKESETLSDEEYRIACAKGLLERYKAEYKENQYLIEHPEELLERLHRNHLDHYIDRISIDESGKIVRNKDGSIKIALSEALRELHQRERTGAVEEIESDDTIASQEEHVQAADEALICEIKFPEEVTDSVSDLD
jgi:hypothetical protein